MAADAAAAAARARGAAIRGRALIVAAGAAAKRLHDAETAAEVAGLLRELSALKWDGGALADPKVYDAFQRLYDEVGHAAGRSALAAATAERLRGEWLSLVDGVSELEGLACCPSGDGEPPPPPARAPAPGPRGAAEAAAGEPATPPPPAPARAPAPRPAMAPAGPPCGPPAAGTPSRGSMAPQLLEELRRRPRRGGQRPSTSTAQLLARLQAAPPGAERPGAPVPAKRRRPQRCDAGGSGAAALRRQFGAAGPCLGGNDGGSGSSTSSSSSSSSSSSESDSGGEERPAPRPAAAAPDASEEAPIRDPADLAAKRGPGAAPAGEASCEGSARRTTVHNKLREALGGAPGVLAFAVENALHRACGGNERRYTQTARSVLFNLKTVGSGSLRSRLLSGALKPEKVPSLTAEDMASAETRAKRARTRRECMEEVQTDWALKHGQANVTGMFTCGKCRSSKTTYYQLQTRSSDEPMTTFVSCLMCGKRWRC